MTATRRFESVLGLASALLVAGMLASMPANAQSAAEQEATKQTTRQVSDSIARRISEAAVTGTKGANGNVWTTGAYNRIEDGEGAFKTNLWQAFLGGDVRLGDVFLGLSFAYANADTGFGVPGGAGVQLPSLSQLQSQLAEAGLSLPAGVQSALSQVRATSGSSSQSYTASPYLSYLFNENLFATVIAGYTYTEADLRGSDADQVFNEISLNGVYGIDAWRFKGKLGNRFAYSWIQGLGGLSGVSSQFLPQGFNVDDETWSNTFLAGAEVGYRIEIGKPFARELFPYLRTQYELFIPGRPGGDSTNAFFLTLGATLDVLEHLSVGLSGQVEALRENDIRNYAGILELRYRF